MPKKGRPPLNEERTAFRITVPNALYQTLIEDAQAAYRTVSAEIERIITHYYRNKSNSNDKNENDD